MFRVVLQFQLWKPDKKDTKNFETKEGKKTKQYYNYIYSVSKDGKLPTCKKGKIVDKDGKINFDNIEGEKQERTS